MTEQKSGVAPTKKAVKKKVVKKKAATKQAVRKPTTDDAPVSKVAPQDVNNSPLEKDPLEIKHPSRRVGMHGKNGQNIPPEARDPNYYFRWCADYDKGKLQEYQGAWYSFVLDDQGKKIKRPGGQPLYLMKLPKDIREQDLLAKRGKIIDINKTMQKEAAVKKEGNVPEYIPEGQDSVTERDNL